MSFMPLSAATLAVGTEVTDGQIIDRNSAWISHKLVLAGFQVIEHRAVADDHEAIERALSELADRADMVFVTGGLGPTSDDFTRELIAKVFTRPLEYHDVSWRHLTELLGSRGIPAREIQKQQCYFPKGARVLKNPAGTANAFAFETQWKGRVVRLYALPGPPTEIAAIWELNLHQEIESFTPENEREELYVIRCLGRGESQVAEVTEPIVAGHPIRIGYRAHVPYVEVKLWFKTNQKSKLNPVIGKLEDVLHQWVVNRNDEDVSDQLIETSQHTPIHLLDAASFGLISERISERLRSRKISNVSLTLETAYAGAPARVLASSLAIVLSIIPDEARNIWSLRIRKKGALSETQLEEMPPYNYKVLSERGRKYITEKALLTFGEALGFEK